MKSTLIAAITAIHCNDKIATGGKALHVPWEFGVFRTPCGYGLGNTQLASPVAENRDA